MRRSLLPYLMLCLCLFLSRSLPAAAQSPGERDAAAAVIAALNAWRLEEDRWPLKPNDTLRAMAHAQASYLLTLPTLPEGGDIHLGREGERPQERARRAPYNWPSYNRPEQIALTEIAYDGADVAAALRFWKDSETHRGAALSQVYREIGAAALAHDGGYLFIVVLGARPNVLPAQVNLGAGLLYLSDERYTYASGGRWIHDAARVRFFDAEGRPLGSGWQPWQMTLPLPQNTGDRLFVMLSDGTVDVLTEVRLERDAAPLPAGLAALLPTATPPPTAIATATPRSGAPVPSSTPIIVPSAPTPPPGSVIPTPTPRGGSDLTLIYDARSLTIWNSAGRALDLTGLVLEQGDRRLPIGAWQTPWLSGSLQAFAARDCLQVWAWSEPTDPPAPSDCRYVRGAITIEPLDRPWLGAPFNVSRNGQRLAACPVAPGRCSFSLD